METAVNEYLNRLNILWTQTAMNKTHDAVPHPSLHDKGGVESAMRECQEPIMRRSIQLSIIALGQCQSNHNIKRALTSMWVLPEWVWKLYWCFAQAAAKCTLCAAGHNWLMNKILSRDSSLAIYGQNSTVIEQHCSCSWTLFLVMDFS